jgi:hypothetical protein
MTTTISQRMKCFEKARKHGQHEKMQMHDEMEEVQPLTRKQAKLERKRMQVMMEEMKMIVAQMTKLQEEEEATFTALTQQFTKDFNKMYDMMYSRYSSSNVEQSYDDDDDLWVYKRGCWKHDIACCRKCFG